MLIVAALALSAQEAQRPEAATALFNGKDFTGLYTWLRDTQRQDPGKVFSVVDGVIRCSGDGFGYVGTEKAWKDYRLVVEYRWGEKTGGSKYVRNSGILLHATGPEGGAGKGAWMPSIEVQLAQGCVGDLIPIRGSDVPVAFSGETAVGPDKRPRWSKGGAPAVYTNRQFWWNKHEPGFKELIDTRGKDDVESPVGEWTKVEIVCKGARISVSVNGTLVNEVFDVHPAAGRILLQNEGFEIHFRTFEIHPL